MKKIFFALAVLVLAFTGCSQEDEAIQTNEQKAIKVVVNMDKPGFGTDARAPRTGWVEGDEVICTIGSPSIGIRLTYDADSDSWTTENLQASGTNYVEADFDEILENGTGNVKAAYFSSKIKELAFLAPPTTTLPTMVVTTNASFISMGECVMTCENGEYSFADGVLTLDIIMKPQVAQYTIRDLNVEDGWNISIHGPVNGYAGGIITPDGII